MEGEDNPLSTGNSRTISRVKKDDHLQELKSKSGEQYSNKYRDIFDYSSSRSYKRYLGIFTAVKHHIDTGNSKPIKQRMRRTPLGYANEEQEHLEKFPKAGVIEPSCSEWASPSVLVRKRDGYVRWCIDLRKLNDVTVKDCYPLYLLQDCIDALE